MHETLQKLLIIALLGGALGYGVYALIYESAKCQCEFDASIMRNTKNPFQ